MSIYPNLAIVGAWLALSLLTAAWTELRPPQQGLLPAFRGSLVFWGLIFVVVGGLGYGIRGLWGAP